MTSRHLHNTTPSLAREYRAQKENTQTTPWNIKMKRTTSAFSGEYMLKSTTAQKKQKTRDEERQQPPILSLHTRILSLSESEVVDKPYSVFMWDLAHASREEFLEKHGITKALPSLNPGCFKREDVMKNLESYLLCLFCEIRKLVDEGRNRMYGENVETNEMHGMVNIFRYPQPLYYLDVDPTEGRYKVFASDFFQKNVQCQVAIGRFYGFRSLSIVVGKDGKLLEDLVVDSIQRQIENDIAISKNRYYNLGDTWKNGFVTVLSCMYVLQSKFNVTLPVALQRRLLLLCKDPWGFHSRFYYSHTTRVEPSDDSIWQKQVKALKVCIGGHQHNDWPVHLLGDVAVSHFTRGVPGVTEDAYGNVHTHDSSRHSMFSPYMEASGSMLRLPILSPFVFVQNEGFEEFFDGMLKRNICYFDLFHELRGDELFDQPYVFNVLYSHLTGLASDRNVGHVLLTRRPTKYLPHPSRDTTFDTCMLFQTLPGSALAHDFSSYLKFALQHRPLETLPYLGFNENAQLFDTWESCFIVYVVCNWSLQCNSSLREIVLQRLKSLFEPFWNFLGRYIRTTYTHEWTNDPENDYSFFMRKAVLYFIRENLTHHSVQSDRLLPLHSMRTRGHGY